MGQRLVQFHDCFSFNKVVFSLRFGGDLGNSGASGDSAGESGDSVGDSGDSGVI